MIHYLSIAIYFTDFLSNQCWKLALWTPKLHLQNGQLALQPQWCQYSRQSRANRYSNWRHISHKSIYRWRSFSATRWIKVFVLHRNVSPFEYFYRISKTQIVEPKCGQLQFDPYWSFVSRKITIESIWYFVLTTIWDAESQITHFMGFHVDIICFWPINNPICLRITI